MCGRKNVVTKRRWDRDRNESKIGERHRREGTGTRRAAWWERRPNHIRLHYLLLNMPVRSGDSQGQAGREPLGSQLRPLQHPQPQIWKIKPARSRSGHRCILSNIHGRRFTRPSQPEAAWVSASSAPSIYGRGFARPGRPEAALVSTSSLLLWKESGPVTY